MMASVISGETAGAIHGWGCTPTGNQPLDAMTSNEENKTRCLPVAIRRGWNRTALYCILVLLMVLVFLNLALTLWIISALKLSMNGIGPIRIVNGGISLSGQAWIVDNLVTSSITSQPAQPLTLHSYRNFTVVVSDPSNQGHSKFVMKRDSIKCSGHVFDISDAKGNSVFRASKDEVRVRANTLNVGRTGGLTVTGSIQASSISAPHSSNLELESLTRRLDLRAPQSIYMESRAGNIDISSSNDIKLSSIVGALKIDAPNIIISHLKEANITGKFHKNVKLKKVFQLCACASGKLFLAAPDAACVAYDDDTDLCR